MTFPRTALQLQHPSSSFQRDMALSTFCFVALISCRTKYPEHPVAAILKHPRKLLACNEKFKRASKCSAR